MLASISGRDVSSSEFCYVEYLYSGNVLSVTVVTVERESVTFSDVFGSDEKCNRCLFHANVKKRLT